MPRTDDQTRDDSIAIGDIIANIPPDELRELVERDALEDYVEDRLAAQDDERDVTAEAVTRARDACRDIREARDAEERDDAAPFVRDDATARDDADGDGS